MKLKEIISVLENIAPLSYQEGYDNAGLLTGNADMKISGALVTLDCIEEVIEEAIANELNLVIAHHPVIFGGIKRLTGSNYIERTIIKAIKNDIAIYAIHTNLDNMNHGVNRKICELLGLTSCRILAPKKDDLRKIAVFVPHQNSGEVRNAMFEAGAGQIGDYSECSYNIEGYGTFKAGKGTDPHVGEVDKQHREPETRIEAIYPVHLEKKIINAMIGAHPYEEVAYDIYKLENKNPLTGAGMVGELDNPMEEETFLKHLKKNMRAEVIRHTKLAGKPVKTVAVCGGSGSFLLGNAIAENADVFVTADFKYHQFFDADGKIVIADIGHYESEQFTKQLLQNNLKEKFPTFAVHLSETNTNPIKYY